MNAKSTSLLGCLLLVGCATATPAPKGASRRPLPGAQVHADTAVSTPARAHALEAPPRASELSAAQGERFDLERQLALLEQEVRLYTQFLERAGDDPELQPAVLKSRERIADARDTIVYLRGLLGVAAQPPATR